MSSRSAHWRVSSSRRAFRTSSAVAKLRKGEDVPYSSLSHPSPLGWEHVDLTDDFIWTGEQKVSENVDGTGPPRTPSEAFLSAA